MSISQAVLPLVVRALALYALAGASPLIAGCATQPVIAGASSGNIASSGDNERAIGTDINSGIYGSMVSARGNPPAHSHPYECVKVFDATGRSRIATGVCSGTLGNFRVLLSPGNYIVEAGGSWENKNGSVYYRPHRTRVEIGPNEWVNLAPPAPPGPVP